MRSALRVTVGAFGVLAGIAGIEHGVGEVLQGNTAPAGLVISSWPDSVFFANLGGEPAMTVVPNLLVSGVLAIAVSLAFLAWVTLFVQRRHGGLVLIALSAILLLVGGGFGPPLLGLILGTAATQIGAPSAGWRRHLSSGGGRRLARVWPWALGGGMLAWLLLFPGLGLLSTLAGVDSVLFVVIVIIAAFSTLTLSILSGLVRDLGPQAGPSAASLRG